MTAKVPVAVLASGGGTNLQALIDACADPSFPARIAVVFSNRAKAGALERARRAGIATEVRLKPKGQAREAYDAEVVRALRSHGVQWVALAGYMRLVTPTFLQAFPERVINIHPSLLPAFPGVDAQRQAWEYGVRISGCTVHFVDEGTDSGAIIGQAAVAVHPSDTEHELQQRILAMEHRLFPMCLKWAVEGRLTVNGRKVSVDLPEGDQLLLSG